MGRGDRSDSTPGEDLRRRVRRVLSEHPVSFAMLFGSAGHGTMDGGSDLDVAVEFDGVRPTDDDYNDTYLTLLADLEDEVPYAVDLVDVNSMSPRFARAAFDGGDVLVGGDERRRELERNVATGELSVAEARERIGAAVERLKADE